MVALSRHALRTARTLDAVPLLTLAHRRRRERWQLVAWGVAIGALAVLGPQALTAWWR